MGNGPLLKIDDKAAELFKSSGEAGEWGDHMKKAYSLSMNNVAAMALVGRFRRMALEELKARENVS